MNNPRATEVVAPEVDDERLDLRAASEARSSEKGSSYLDCNKLSYIINGNKILHNIDAIIPPGRLVALMGPSGAGKTTLLNVLGGRGKGKVSGSITLNNVPVTRKIMRKESKLVPQHDYMTPVLTARETLMYTAKLAMPPTQDRAKRVEEVIDLLSLRSCADVVCGGPMLKGLSGGQLKRVSIGMELINDPSILFLDEPTSGLDSSVASDVVDLIKALAQGGRTVICTIHQPSFQVFSKFDWLLMLDKGRVAYNGETANLSNYLTEIQRPCPAFINPVDHLMEVLSEPAPGMIIAGKGNDPEMPGTAGIEDPGFNALFNGTSLGNAAAQDLQGQRSLRDSLYPVSKNGKMMVSGDGPPKENPTSFFSQFATIFARAFYVTAKDKGQLRTRVAQLVFMGLIISTIFLQMENTQSRVQDRLSVMFLLVLFLSMSSIMQTAMALPEEQHVFLREIHNGYYSSTAYFLGRVGVLVFFQIVYAICFGSAVYFVLGFYPAATNFLIFLATLAIMSTIAGLAGFTAGTVFPTAQQATNIVPMIVMPLSIFAGLFVPLANIPSYFVWVYYLSFFQYAIQVMMVNEFQDQNLDPCTVDEILNPTGACPFGPCSSNFTDPQSCPGTVVLDKFDYDPDNMSMNIGILIGFVAALLILGSLTMKRLVAKSK